MIVEDNLVLQGPFAELLADEGMSPVVAKTVEEALARLAERSFDAMLLDVRLGDGSGARILDALADQPARRCFGDSRCSTARSTSRTNVSRSKGLRTHGTA